MRGRQGVCHPRGQGQATDFAISRHLFLLSGACELTDRGRCSKNVKQYKVNSSKLNLCILRVVPLKPASGRSPCESKFSSRRNPALGNLGDRGKSSVGLDPAEHCIFFEKHGLLAKTCFKSMPYRNPVSVVYYVCCGVCIG